MLDSFLANQSTGLHTVYKAGGTYQPVCTLCAIRLVSTGNRIWCAETGFGVQKPVSDMPKVDMSESGEPTGFYTVLKPGGRLLDRHGTAHQPVYTQCANRF